MTSRILSPGELAKGQHITVLEVIEDDETFTEPMFRAGPQAHNLVGVPLVIVAIDLPFVLTKLPAGQRFTVDTRRLRLMELKPEFASAFAPEPEPPETHPQFGNLVRAHNDLAQQVIAIAEKLPSLVRPPDPRPWWKRHAWDLGWFLLIATACLLTLYQTHA